MIRVEAFKRRSIASRAQLAVWRQTASVKQELDLIYEMLVDQLNWPDDLDSSALADGTWVAPTKPVKPVKP